MFTNLYIHELLSNQVGCSEEINDYRNDSVVIDNSLVVPGQKGLIAIDFIPKHSIIFSFNNTVSYERTRTSIQVGPIEHIEAGDFGSYTNHSCEPNTMMWSHIRHNSQEGQVVCIALQDIQKGEELYFDYATTESELTPELKSKECLCGKVNCRTKIKSFSDLTEKQKEQLSESIGVAKYLGVLYSVI